VGKNCYVASARRRARRWNAHGGGRRGSGHIVSPRAQLVLSRLQAQLEMYLSEERAGRYAVGSVKTRIYYGIYYTIYYRIYAAQQRMQYLGHKLRLITAIRLLIKSVNSYIMGYGDPARVHSLLNVHVPEGRNPLCQMQLYVIVI